MTQWGFYIPIPSSFQGKSIIKTWLLSYLNPGLFSPVGLQLQFYDRSQIKYAPITTVFIFVLQEFDKEVKSFVFVLEGSSQTNKIQLPKENKQIRK